MAHAPAAAATRASSTFVTPQIFTLTIAAAQDGGLSLKPEQAAEKPLPMLRQAQHERFPSSYFQHFSAHPDLLSPKVCAWRADSQNFLSFRGLCRKWGAISTRHSGESRNPDSSPTPHLDTGFRRYDGPTNWTSCAKSLPGEGTWGAGSRRAELVEG